MVQLMQKMSLLLSKTPASDVRSDVLPLLYRALDTDTATIQEMCLSSLPTCAKHLDKQTMKTQLLPRIQKLCLATTTLSVRVSCLVCVGRLLTHLDKWLVLDMVVPFVTKLPSKESPVIMAAVGILQVSMKSTSLGFTKEIMANTILPFLLPLTIENCLSPQQHKTLMTLVREMIDKVEAEHRTKLEYLNSIKEEQNSLRQIMPDASTLESLSTSKTSGSSSVDSEMDNVFAGLGLGQYVTKSAPIGNGGNSAPISPLTPATTAAKPATPTPAKSNGSRDLTATLAASPLPPPPAHSNSINSLSSFNAFQSPNQAPVTNVQSLRPSNVTSPFPTNFGSVQTPPKLTSNATTKPSPFDNLFATPSAKSQPMNKMATSQPMVMGPSNFNQPPSQNWVGSTPMMPANNNLNSIMMGNNNASTGMMGNNSAMMGNNNAMMGNNSAMMGTNSAMMGTNSAMMGNNSAMMGTNSAMMGNNSAMMMGNNMMMGGNNNVVLSPMNNTPAVTMTTQNNSFKPLSTSDISSFLN